MEGNTHDRSVAATQMNAFTVDVEDYFHVAALSSAIARDTWDNRELRVQANTEKLLEILGERGVHATFFVLGWLAERAPALVRRIAAAGDRHLHSEEGGRGHREFRERAPRGRAYAVRLRSCPRQTVKVVVNWEDRGVVAKACIDQHIECPE